MKRNLWIFICLLGMNSAFVCAVQELRLPFSAIERMLKRRESVIKFYRLDHSSNDVAFTGSFNNRLVTLRIIRMKSVKDADKHIQFIEYTMGHSAKIRSVESHEEKDGLRFLELLDQRGEMVYWGKKGQYILMSGSNSEEGTQIAKRIMLEAAKLVPSAT